MTSIKPSRRKWLIASASAGLCALAHTRLARGAEVVRIIVGFPPGQATDIVARLLAEQLKTVTGDNYIVDNRPGQGGSIAMGITANSPADGTVMMLTHMSAVATNPHLYKSVRYNSKSDFKAIGLVGDLPFVLVCHPSQPFTTIPELIDYAKKHPGKLTHASSGNGTVSHLAMEEFKRRAGIDVLHVPYKGSAPGLTDVVAGQVSLALETAAGVQPFVKSGQLRALATATPKRLPGMPKVPTTAEQGFADFTAATWLMLIYPARTPDALVSSTFDALSKVMSNPEVSEKLAQIGAIGRTSANPQEAAAYIRSEYDSWGEVVKRSGVVLD